MKNITTIVTLAALFTGAAFAADQYLGSVSTTGAVSNCYPQNLFGQKLAVQCKQGACHTGTFANRDGGGNSLAGTAVDVNSVLVSQNVLYDIDVSTGATPFVCFIGQDGGAVIGDIYVRGPRLQ